MSGGGGADRGAGGGRVLVERGAGDGRVLVERGGDSDSVRFVPVGPLSGPGRSLRGGKLLPDVVERVRC